MEREVKTYVLKRSDEDTASGFPYGGTMHHALTHATVAIRVRPLCAAMLFWSAALMMGCESAPTTPPPPPLPKLMVAVQAGDVAQVKQLVAAGESPDQYADGKSSLLIAVTRCDVEMTTALFALGGAVNKHVDRMILKEALKCNHFPLVELLANHGADVNGLSKWEGQSVSLLGLAAATGQVDLAKLLLSKKVKVDDVCAYDFCEGYHYTALHLAALTGNAEIAQLLLTHGANPMALDKYKNTPLILLARHARGTDTMLMNTIKVLVAGGTEINWQSPNGPALAFISESRKNVRALMIELGASTQVVTDFARAKSQMDEALARIDAKEKERAAKAAEEEQKSERVGVVPGASPAPLACTCTNRAMSWVPPSSSSGMVRGHRGHYNFHDEKVPCACR